MSKNFKDLNDLIHSGVKEIVLDSDIILENGESSNDEYSLKLDVDGLIIDGNGYAIDGRDKTHWILCTGENIIIKNITIKNIKLHHPLITKGKWSAINNCGGELTITDSIFKNNHGFGGAIYNEGVLIISNCKFIHNSGARVGGAIYNRDGLIIINNSIFTNNKAVHDGGAIYSPGGVLSIKNSEFSNNFAGYDGGAILAPDDVLSLENCTFKDNKYDDVFKMEYK